jgi:hypothetical protein
MLLMELLILALVEMVEALLAHHPEVVMVVQVLL